MVVRFCGESCPVVRCNVGGIGVNFLVDTGSKVSLVKEEVFSSPVGECFKTSQGMRSMKLVGITGKPLSTRGCYDLPFKLGSTTFRHARYVCTDEAQFPTAGIFGQDVLRAQNVDIITSRGVIFIGGVEVPILNWQPLISAHCDVGTMQEEIEPCEGAIPVRLARKCTIPPLSQMLVMGKVGVAPNSLGVIEMRTLETHGLLGADVLACVDSDGEVPLRVANSTPVEMCLPKNKVVANFVVAEEQRVGDIAVGDGDASGEVRPDITALFALDHMEMEERNRVMQLVEKYREAFALHKMDLGKCDVIKHRIPTRESPPVYRRAYRIPYAKREDMQQQVDALLDNGVI